MQSSSHMQLVRCGLAALSLSSVELASTAAQGAQPPMMVLKQSGRWASQPSAEEIEAAKPADLKGQAFVTFRDCSVGAAGELKGCRVSAYPTSPLVAAAGERLLARYRVDQADAKTVIASKGRIEFDIVWPVLPECVAPCRPLPGTTAPKAN